MGNRLFKSRESRELRESRKYTHDDPFIRVGNEKPQGPTPHPDYRPGTFQPGYGWSNQDIVDLSGPVIELN